MIGNVLGDAIIRFFFLFLPMFTIMMFFIQVEIQFLIAIGIIALITLATLMSLGILVSLTVVLWKDVRGIIGIIGLLFQFLGGAFFPVQTFPEPVQMLALLMPYTLGFDLVRWASFEGSWITILPLEIEVILLVVYAFLYLAVSVFLMKRVIRHAKTKGLHLI
jgi:ABC-2 type transport system permease protein